MSALSSQESLKEKLGVVTSWIEEGRTDAWIAHQLGVSGDELTAFKRESGLIEGEPLAEEAPSTEIPDEEAAGGSPAGLPEEATEATPTEDSAGQPRYEATFDHGGEAGYGLWLDPSVADNPLYKEHWSGVRSVTVTIDEGQIIINRA